MIEVSSISKSYGKIKAVSNVSFSMEKGDIIGFIGRNGAGKSTTMGIMTGCIVPNSGTVIVDGHDISQSPLKAKSLIGFLPEQPPIYNEFTVNEYLSVMFDMKRIRGSKKDIINDAIEKSGLSEMKSRRCGNLSKGYRQRVGLAQSILGNPKYIILDEPTEGMDPEQKKEMLRLIKLLGRETGIILSSHILSEIDKICNRIIMLEEGKLITDESGFNENKKHGNSVVYTYIINADPEGIRNTLGVIPGIHDIKIVQSEKKNTECIIEMSNKRVCTAVFYALAEVGMPIMGMSEYTVSAELYFRDRKRQLRGE